MGNPPVFTIPGDHVVHEDFVYAQAPNNLWHLPQTKWQSIWSRVTGRSVVVANLDTGFSSHPDLPTPKITKSFIGGQSVDDGNSHGTHTIGTILGRNGIGVAPDAELIVGKVLSNQGSGSSQGIVNGVKWAVDQGADVISMSLGGGSYDAMRTIGEYALSKGVVLVAAAGNAGYRGSNTIGYPARYLEYLCIGATRQGGGIANFSSGGRELDIACPGENIISTSNRGSGYISMSGTSMATPFAAGVIALIIELVRREGHASMSGVDAWRTFFSQWSEDRGDPGKDVRYGYGIPRYEDIVNSLVGDDLKWL